MGFAVGFKDPRIRRMWHGAFNIVEDGAHRITRGRVGAELAPSSTMKNAPCHIPLMVAFFYMNRGITKIQQETRVLLLCSDVRVHSTSVFLRQIAASSSLGSVRVLSMSIYRNLFSFSLPSFLSCQRNAFPSEKLSIAWQMSVVWICLRLTSRPYPDSTF